MADTGIFCTTAEVQYKAGAGASAVANTEAYINKYVEQAESAINCHCKYNFSDTYASLNADFKKLLTEAASDLAAIYVINFDMSGFTSRQEALTMINVLWARYQDALKDLFDSNVKEFIGAT